MNDVTEMNDSELVEIIRTRDNELYAEIIKRYQKKLLRYASYIMNDEQTGADVVQEGFIKAFINLNGFDTKKSFSSWIYRIVHNEAMNALGKNKKHANIDEAIDYDSGIYIEDDFIQQELVNRTHYCLNMMPLIYKEPLSLMYLEEKSYEEISDILRIPVGTVGTRINRAKHIMKHICQKNT